MTCSMQPRRSTGSSQSTYGSRAPTRCAWRSQGSGPAERRCPTAGRVCGWAVERAAGRTVESLPETTFARAADGTYLAYQVSGDGPLDLVFLIGGGIPIEDQMEGR